MQHLPKKSGIVDTGEEAGSMRWKQSKIGASRVVNTAQLHRPDVCRGARPEGRRREGVDNAASPTCASQPMRAQRQWAAARGRLLSWAHGGFSSALCASERTGMARPRAPARLLHSRCSARYPLAQSSASSSLPRPPAHMPLPIPGPPNRACESPSISVPRSLQLCAAAAGPRLIQL